MEVKPIFLVGLPDLLPREEFEKVSYKLKSQLTDYHVILYYNKVCDFKVLNGIYPEEIDLTNLIKAITNE